MLDFVREYFKKLFVVTLWIVFVGCTVAGIVVGVYVGSAVVFALEMYVNPIRLIGQIVGAIVGGGLGFFAGVFFIVIGGGLISLLLNINDRINDLADAVSRLAKNQSEPDKSAGE